MTVGAGVLREPDWDRLIKQLSRGDCTPLLGAGASFGRLPTGGQLAQYFADRYQYPFADSHDLARVMQYAAWVSGDTVELKHEVCTYLQQYAPSGDACDTDPHAMLAKFPIKTFLTTNYDDFMLRALHQETGGRKKPVSQICSWWDVGVEKPYIEQPTEAEPLIYHLHGRWNDPRSLVLTEDDYLTYLGNLVEVNASAGSPLPSTVLHTMTVSPLLFVGYSLRDWNFRVLFYGLLKTMPQNMRRRHVSVQLMPDLNTSVADAAGRAREYLQRYLDGWNITIFIGSTEEFFEELRSRM
ncbi:SIR2 family protein [Nonomuraea sp. NPDC049419]|uniref:SIR2 family NAD-dependent protein deacylase n=1 Tax=Nonomuraea sp. NPDC049419 TaxID=3155772 RepID=UPI003440CFE1